MLDAQREHLCAYRFIRQRCIIAPPVTLPGFNSRFYLRILQRGITDSVVKDRIACNDRVSLYKTLIDR